MKIINVKENDFCFRIEAEIKGRNYIIEGQKEEKLYLQIVLADFDSCVAVIKEIFQNDEFWRICGEEKEKRFTFCYTCYLGQVQVDLNPNSKISEELSCAIHNKWFA